MIFIELQEHMLHQSAVAVLRCGVAVVSLLDAFPKGQSAVAVVLLCISLVPRPSHTSVCRLQATNPGVRRPGNEASIASCVHVKVKLQWMQSNFPKLR